MSPIVVESLSESASAQTNPLKDATNILKALFKKHDAFTVKIKERPFMMDEPDIDK
jgi:hypothetical protein